MGREREKFINNLNGGQPEILSEAQFHLTNIGLTSMAYHDHLRLEQEDI